MSRTDRMERDLELGYTALEEGRIDEAAASLNRCKRIDRRHPLVIGLAAAVADATGDVEEALVQYRALADLHPDDAPPRIAVARLELHDIGDPDAALATLAGVFELIDEETDLIDAVMIRTEALLVKEDLKAAREALAELATSAIDDPSLALDLAELALATEDPPAAKRSIATARKAGNSDGEGAAQLEADALHLLGRVHELAEETAEMVSCWQSVRVLDAKAPPGELEISEDDLEKIAIATLAELPAHVREKLEKVPILIDDAPSEELVADGLDPRILGLFQGATMSEDAGLTGTVTNILLFRKNLERTAEDEEQLRDEVRITVLHETAHYFGLEEEDLEKLGLD